MLFDRCLETGKILSEWKETLTTPLNKEGENLNTANFRSISLLSQTYKLRSRIIKKRLNNIIIKEIYLSDEQADFREGANTAYDLVTLKIITEKIN